LVGHFRDAELRGHPALAREIVKPHARAHRGRRRQFGKQRMLGIEPADVSIRFLAEVQAGRAVAAFDGGADALAQVLARHPVHLRGFAELEAHGPFHLGGELLRHGQGGAAGDLCPQGFDFPFEGGVFLGGHPHLGFQVIAAVRSRGAAPVQALQDAAGAHRHA
jgi:hypothetical protein